MPRQWRRGERLLHGDATDRVSYAQGRRVRFGSPANRSSSDAKLPAGDMGAVLDSDSAYDLLGHSTKKKRAAANSAFGPFDHLIGGRAARAAPRCPAPGQS